MVRLVYFVKLGALCIKDFHLLSHYCNVNFIGGQSVILRQPFVAMSIKGNITG